jgi:RNA polymerase sigma-70 factor (ECF subfamily)
MLGSFHDAQDAVQETLLRAWKYLASLQDPGSLRAWLHRIATNVCLRRRAHVANDPIVTSATLDAFTPTVTPPYNLSPYPDALLNELQSSGGNPDVEYDLYESVQFAFLTAMQLLPPRQRAVLLLHDVIGFTLVDIAEMLDTTVASVNGALNRARATLRQPRTGGRLRTHRRPPSDHVAESFVERCVAAWQAADIASLSDLLKADVVMGAPTWGLRLNGRSTVCEFLGRVPAPDERAKFRLIVTRANRQPALAVYRLDGIAHTETYRALAIVVLTMDGNAIPPESSCSRIQSSCQLLDYQHMFNSFAPTDHFGVGWGSHLIGQPIGRSSMNKAIVAQLEIRGKDEEALKRFYASLFGWRIRSDDCGAHVAYCIDPSGAGIEGAISGQTMAESSLTWKWTTFSRTSPMRRSWAGASSSRHMRSCLVDGA